MSKTYVKAIYTVRFIDTETEQTTVLSKEQADKLEEALEDHIMELGLADVSRVNRVVFRPNPKRRRR